MLLGRWIATGGPGRIWPTALVVRVRPGLVALVAALRLRRVRLAGFVEVQRTVLAIIGFTPILFLIGVLDARLARSGVSDLVVQLRGNPDAAELQAALARALRDPRSSSSTGSRSSAATPTPTVTRWRCPSRATGAR